MRSPFGDRYLSDLIAQRLARSLRNRKVPGSNPTVGMNFYTLRNEVRGVYWNHHVRLSSAFGVSAHNCFPFTPIIMKRHMQTPHEARMCPIDFEVKGSKVKVTMHKLLKIVSGA